MFAGPIQGWLCGSTSVTFPYVPCLRGPRRGEGKKDKKGKGDIPVSFETQVVVVHRLCGCLIVIAQELGVQEVVVWRT